jgi:hypothetical protein
LLGQQIQVVVAVVALTTDHLLVVQVVQAL